MSPLGPTPPSTSATGDRAALRKAAEGFEAMFVRRMLEAARAADFDADADSEGGMAQFTALRDTHLADIAAQHGAFGVADAIEAQLARLSSGGGGA